MTHVTTVKSEFFGQHYIFKSLNQSGHVMIQYNKKSPKPAMMQHYTFSQKYQLHESHQKANGLEAIG